MKAPSDAMGRACLKEGLKGVKVRFLRKNMLGEGKVIQALIGVIVEISPYRSLTVRRGFELLWLLTSVVSLPHQLEPPSRWRYGFRLRCGEGLILRCMF